MSRPGNIAGETACATNPGSLACKAGGQAFSRKVSLSGTRSAARLIARFNLKLLAHALVQLKAVFSGAWAALSLRRYTEAA